MWNLKIWSLFCWEIVSAIYSWSKQQCKRIQRDDKLYRNRQLYLAVTIEAMQESSCPLGERVIISILDWKSDIKVRAVYPIKWNHYNRSHHLAKHRYSTTQHTLAASEAIRKSEQLALITAKDCVFVVSFDELIIH